MENTDLAPPEPSTPMLVAPLWHTVLVVIILLGLSALGALTAHFQSGVNPAAARTRIPSYVLTIVMEWLVLGFVWFGIRRYGFRLQHLIGGGWSSPAQAIRDLGIAVVFLFMALVILGALAGLLHATPNQAVRRLIPQTPAEVLLYLLLALTAGFCEEIVFRGYLMRQFSTLTENGQVGLVLQGLLFGAAHGYQGLRYMLLIAVYGCMFGLLAQSRRSLRPGIIAHFLQDGGVGLIAGHSTKLLC